MWLRKKERQVIEKLKQTTSVARLSDLERQRGRNSLIQFMQAHPVREGHSPRHLRQIRGRETFLPAPAGPTFSLFLTKKYMMATLAIILVLALSGGVTYAAEGTLPGDVLYPIKVKVNEEVWAALATSAEAEADWNVRRAERRLEEAAVLVATGRLNDETRARIEERFTAHAERVQARVEKFESEGKEEQAERVAERLAVSLQVHERILDKIADAVKDGDRVEIEVKPLVRKIRAERRANEAVQAAVEARLEAKAAIEESNDDQVDEVDEVRVTTTVMIQTEAAAVGRREAAKHKIAEAERFIARADLSAEAQAEAEARLNEAKTLLVTGEVELTVKEFDAAFSLFGQAHRVAQSAKVSIQAHTQLQAHLPPGLKLKIELKDDEPEE